MRVLRINGKMHNPHPSWQVVGVCVLGTLWLVAFCGLVVVLALNIQQAVAMARAQERHMVQLHHTYSAGGPVGQWWSGPTAQDSGR